MTLRVLSGIIVPEKKVGYVTVEFNPHQVIARDNSGKGVKLNEAGGSGDFLRKPTVNVSLRQIKVSGNDRTYKIDDAENSPRNVVIGWSYYQQSPIQEISYMIIGDVA